MLLGGISFLHGLGPIFFPALELQTTERKEELLQVGEGGKKRKEELLQVGEADIFYKDEALLPLRRM